MMKSSPGRGRDQFKVVIPTFPVDVAAQGRSNLYLASVKDLCPSDGYQVIVVSRKELQQVSQNRCQ